MSSTISQKNKLIFELQFLYPWYWAYWLFFATWWLFVQLPYPLLLLAGKGIGRLLMFFGTDRRLVTKRNIELCFPEFSEQQRKKILVESFESGGIGFLEMGMAWWWPDWRLKKICRITGMENIKKLNGQGALLLGMHFTTLDIGGAGLSLYQSYGSMYRAHKNRLFNYVQFRGRSRERMDASNNGLVIFPREDLRTMIRLLREGKLVWYAPDQDYGKQHSVFAPFFGVPAATITATAKLVQMGKASVLPFTHKRLARGKGYEITIHPPLQNYPAGDDVKDAETINKVIEHHIRNNPGQYLWAHRRFKTTLGNTADPYPEIQAAQLARRARRQARRMNN